METAFIGREHRRNLLWVVPKRWRARWIASIGRRVRAATEEEAALVINRPVLLTRAVRMQQRVEAQSLDPPEDVATPHTTPPEDLSTCAWCGNTYRNLGAHQRYCRMRERA